MKDFFNQKANTDYVSLKPWNYILQKKTQKFFFQPLMFS